MMKPLLLAWLLPCSYCSVVAAADPPIDSIAGTGRPENNGDSGPADAINIGDPFGVEFGPDGALYVTEVRNHRIRRVDLATRIITTVAGCGRRGYSGDGGPAVDAELNEPYEVRFDAHGDMYFVEMRNHIVRRVDGKTGAISTVAGTGRQGYGGDGGPASKALFNQPHSIVLDNNGGLYIADIGNHRIRRVDLRTGIVESIAGNGERQMPQVGQPARGNPIFGPRALYVDGNALWIALREGHSVWRMKLVDGILEHIAGTGRVGYTGDGGPAIEATFNGPKGIAIGPNGNVFVADSENHAVRCIDVRTGVVSTAVGDAAAEGRLKSPHGICVASDGSVFIGDTSNHRVARVAEKTVGSAP